MFFQNSGLANERDFFVYWYEHSNNAELLINVQLKEFS